MYMNAADASPSAQTFNDDFFYLTAYICSAIYKPYPQYTPTTADHVSIFALRCSIDARTGFPDQR